jgi:sorbitol-specific phosphotransferase system component IIA
MNETESSTALSTKPEPQNRKPRKRELKNLFRRDGVWQFHKVVKGQRVFNGRKTPFSLETTDLAVAKAKRDAILKAAGGAEVDRVLGRAAANVSTIQDVLDAFELADHPREKTRKKYMRDFRFILRKAWGERDLAKTSIMQLGAEVVHTYQDAVVAAVRAAGHGDMSEEMQVAKYTANRAVTQARAIFANEKPFRKLHLPRPAGFLEADLFQVKRDLSFNPMTAAESALFAAKSKELRARASGETVAADSEAAALTPEQAAGTYLLWLGMRWLGMRNSEVEFCKPAEWLVQTPRGWVMRITNRDYFLVKAVGSVRDLPLAEWLHAELVQFAGEREWLLPGKTVTDRHEIAAYTLNDWMGEVYERAIAEKILPPATESRTAYDWRKQAGSELYAKTKDILQTSKWLGHQSVHTTTKWYVNLISGLPSLA